MSHIVTAELKITEKTLPYLKAAVKEENGRWLTETTHKMWDGTLEGIGFMLPDWRYPVVVTSDGTLKYDNYNGAWGRQKQLDNVIQKTVARSITASAKRLGYTRTKETVDEDGRLVVTLTCY